MISQVKLQILLFKKKNIQFYEICKSMFVWGISISM